MMLVCDAAVLGGDALLVHCAAAGGGGGVEDVVCMHQLLPLRAAVHVIKGCC